MAMADVEAAIQKFEVMHRAKPRNSRTRKRAELAILNKMTEIVCGGRLAMTEFEQLRSSGAAGAGDPWSAIVASSSCSAQ